MNIRRNASFAFSNNTMRGQTSPSTVVWSVHSNDVAESLLAVFVAGEEVGGGVELTAETTMFFLLPNGLSLVSRANLWRGSGHSPDHTGRIGMRQISRCFLTIFSLLIQRLH